MVLIKEVASSGGYVMETLQAALWCLVKTDNYKACVLKAVNRGWILILQRRLQADWHEFYMDMMVFLLNGWKNCREKI